MDKLRDTKYMSEKKKKPNPGSKYSTNAVRQALLTMSKGDKTRQGV